MNKVLIAAALTLAGAATAQAADLRARPYTKAAPIVDAAYDWSGFYIGAHGGGGWGNSDWTVVTDQTTFVDLPPAGLGSHLTSHKVSGGLGGGQIGYQKQFGQWVLGGEFSGAFSALEGSSKSIFQAADDIYTTKITDLFLATGRVGYAAGMWMPYIRAGFASANVKTSIVDTNPPIPSGAAGTWFARERHYGWTAGVGIEYAIAPNWIVGVQYDHVGLDSKNHSALGVTSSGVSQLWAGDIDVDRIDLVTARISYKFGAGPVVAKY